MQATLSIRAIREANPGDRVTYFSSDPSTGLLMECRERRNSGKLTPQGADADHIGKIAMGLESMGVGKLTQERLGAYRYAYYITLNRRVESSDIKQASEYERPTIESEAA